MKHKRKDSTMDTVIQKLKALGCDASRETVNEQLDKLKQKKRGDAEEAARDVQNKFTDFASLLTHIQRMLTLNKNINLHAEEYDSLAKKASDTFSHIIQHCKERDDLQMKYDQANQYIDFYQLSEEIDSYISLAEYVVSTSQEDLRIYLHSLIALKNRYFYLDTKSVEKVAILGTVLEQLKQQNVTLETHLNTFLTRIDIKNLEDSNLVMLFANRQVSSRASVEGVQALTRKLEEFAPKFENLLLRAICTEEQTASQKIALSVFEKLCSYGYTLSPIFKDVFSSAVMSSIFPFGLPLATSLSWEVRYGLLQRISFMSVAGLLSEELLRLILLIIYNQMTLVISLGYLYSETSAKATVTASPDAGLAASTITDVCSPPETTQPPSQSAAVSSPDLQLGSSPLRPTAVASNSTSPSIKLTQSLDNTTSRASISPLASPVMSAQQNIYCWSDFLACINIEPKKLSRVQNMCYIGPILEQKQINVTSAQDPLITDQVAETSYPVLIMKLLYLTAPISIDVDERLKRILTSYFNTIQYLINGLYFFSSTIPSITKGIVEVIVNLLLVQLSQFITTRKTDIILFSSVGMSALNVCYHLLNVMSMPGSGYADVTKSILDFVASLEKSLLRSYIFTAQTVARAIGMCSLASLSALDNPSSPQNCNFSVKQGLAQDVTQDTPPLQIAALSTDLLDPVDITVRNDAAHTVYSYGILRHVHAILRVTVAQKDSAGNSSGASASHDYAVADSLCLLGLSTLLEHTAAFISNMKSTTVSDLSKSFATIVQAYASGALYSLQILKEYQISTSDIQSEDTGAGTCVSANQPSTMSPMPPASLGSGIDLFDKLMCEKLFGTCTIAGMDHSILQLIRDCFIVQTNLLPLLASKVTTNVEPSSKASTMGHIFSGVSLLDELQYRTETAKALYSSEAILEASATITTSQFANVPNADLYNMSTTKFIDSSSEQRTSDPLARYSSFNESKVFLRASQSISLILSGSVDFYLDLLLSGVFNEIDELISDITKPKIIMLAGSTYVGLSDDVLAALHHEAVTTITDTRLIEFTPLINQIFSLSCLHNVLVAISRARNKLAYNGLEQTSTMWLDAKERIFAYLQHHIHSGLLAFRESRDNDNLISAIVLNFLFQSIAGRDVVDVHSRSSAIKDTLDLVTRTLQLKFKRLTSA